MTHSSDVFHIAFDVPYGELSTMLVQASDTLDEPVLVFTSDEYEVFVFNWEIYEFERVMPLWPTKQP